MPIFNIPVDQITEGDLRKLIEVGVPEGLTLDFKRDTYGRQDADVKEFLKDVSSLARAVSG
jgi:hypothetical protein